MSDLFRLSAKGIDGKTRKMSDYQGRVLLIVNTASQCGFTGQYKGLEALHQAYGDKGLVVMGFPSNEFGQQEPGGDEEIAQFCERNFGVSFPMFSKVEVNGADAHPVFAHLKSAAPGVLGSEGIKWNFTKFLVSRDGMRVKRFASTDTPESLVKAIEALL